MNFMQRYPVLLAAGILLLGIILGYLASRAASPGEVNINIDLEDSLRRLEQAERNAGDSQQSYSALLAQRQDLEKALAGAREAYSNLESENSRLRGDLVHMQNEAAAKSGGEELAPGYNRCIELSKNDFDMKDCSTAAVTYWDRRLNAIYKRILRGCSQDQNPPLCVKYVKNLENQWIGYKDNMSKFIYNGGSYKPVGGTSQRFLGIDFLAQETKKQCVILENLFQE